MSSEAEWTLQWRINYEVRFRILEELRKVFVVNSVYLRRNFIRVLDNKILLIIINDDHWMKFNNWKIIILCENYKNVQE